MMSSTRESMEYTEVIAVLNELPQEDFNKIPQKVINFLISKRNLKYDFYIDINIPLEDQNISEKAKMILAIIFRDYLATDKQKEKILNFENAERIRLDNKAREKYSADNIFKESAKKQEFVKEEMSLLEYKEKNIFIKIWDKLKQILKPKN